MNLTNEHNQISIQEGNKMKELFKEEYDEAEEKLYKKGFYVSNMIYSKNEFEVWNSDCKVVIDHLSLSQIVQLSNIL